MASLSTSLSENDAVDKLNLEAARQIERAYESDRVRPEHEEARERAMQSKSAVSVYKHRVHVFAHLFLALAAVCALCVSSLPVSIVSGVFVYFYVDFYGGLLHYVLDEPSNMKTPLIDEGCLEFQWHHNIPNDISSQPFAEVLGALNTLLAVKWTSTALIGAWLFPNPLEYRLLLTLLGWGAVFAALGQYSHRNAHTPKERRSALAIFLQDKGIIIDAAAHHAHHRAAFDSPHKPGFARTYPILNGYSGVVLERVLEAVPSPKFWTAMWFVFTFTDMVFFITVTRLITSILF